MAGGESSSEVSEKRESRKRIEEAVVGEDSADFALLEHEARSRKCQFRKIRQDPYVRRFRCVHPLEHFRTRRSFAVVLGLRRLPLGWYPMISQLPLLARAGSSDVVENNQLEIEGNSQGGMMLLDEWKDL